MTSGEFVSSGPRTHRVHRTWKLWVTTRPKRRRRWHAHPFTPGEVLGDELEEIGLTAKSLADILEVPPNRLYQLLAGKRNVSADTALRLGRYFGMSADFWMNLQSTYELDVARQQTGKSIQRNSDTQRDCGAKARCLKSRSPRRRSAYVGEDARACEHATSHEKMLLCFRKERFIP